MAGAVDAAPAASGAGRAAQLRAALDDAELLTCPSAPRRRNVSDREEWRAWVTGSLDLPPPPFESSKWLSYAWTRRALSANASGKFLKRELRETLPLSEAK